MQWYYAIDGQQQGPVEQNELIALARGGKLRPTDLVWNQTLGSQWAQAQTVPELFPAQDSAAPGASPALWSDSASFAGRTANRDLMRDARASLSGQWGLGVGVTVVFLAITIALGFLPFIGGLIQFVIKGPMLLGLAILFLALSRGSGASFGMMFEGFQRFGTSFLSTLLIGVFVLLWSLPGIVVALCGVGAILVPLLVHAVGTPGAVDPRQLLLGLLGATGGAALLFVLGGILAIVPSIIATYRYSMTYYVIVETADVGPLEAIRRSKRMMHGNKWKYFCLQCRFIGWGLLCVLTLGIGCLWLSPYMMTSMARFYDDLKAGRNG